MAVRPRRKHPSTKGVIKSATVDRLKITSIFIALCAHACRRQFFDFVVAPYEADMQCGRRHPNAIVVTGDGDLLAYGHKQVLIVDSWQKEKYRLFDMSTYATNDGREREVSSLCLL